MRQETLNLLLDRITEKSSIKNISGDDCVVKKAKKFALKISNDIKANDLIECPNVYIRYPKSIEFEWYRTGKILRAITNDWGHSFEAIIINDGKATHKVDGEIGEHVTFFMLWEWLTNAKEKDTIEFETN
jgi:hypothetical protein